MKSRALPPPAVILAAGRGNRLLPLTEHIPKCLVRVGEKTLLEHQLDALAANGIREVHVVTGHGAEHVQKFAREGVSFAHNAAFDRTNSIDTLGMITIEPTAAGLVIMNSDVLVHTRAIAALLADPRENVLLADFARGLGEEEMKIIVDGENRVLEISKTLDPRRAQAENVGILWLGPEAARRLIAVARDAKRPARVSWVPDGVQTLCGDLPFHALQIPPPWTEIDYPHDLDYARSKVLPLFAGL